MANVPKKNSSFNLQDSVDRYQIQQVHANLDTIVIFCRRLPRKIRSELEQLIGKRPRINKTGEWGHLIFLHQPSRPTLDYLRDKDRQTTNPAYALTLNRVDTGVEFITVEQEYANEMQFDVERHVHLKWNRAVGVRDYDGTLYWQGAGKSRNLVAYADKPARTVEGKHPCFRLELRLNQQTLKRYGLTTIDDLVHLNPSDLFNRMTRYVHFENKDEIRLREKVIRRESIRLTRGKGKVVSSHRLIRRYENRGYVGKRINNYFQRYGIILSHNRRLTAKDRKGNWLQSLIPTIIELPTIEKTMEFGELQCLGT